MKHKLYDSSGETLVEVLASIVIAVLSVSLLYGGIMSSVHINENAQNADEVHYEVLSAAEQRSVPLELSLPMKVRVENVGNACVHDLEVSLYGGDGIYSYGISSGPAAGGGTP